MKNKIKLINFIFIIFILNGCSGFAERLVVSFEKATFKALK